MSKNGQSPDHEEAARWFAKGRRGVMTLEEREGLSAWLRAPENEGAMAELRQVWDWLHVAQDRLGPATAPARSVERPRIARSALLAVMCAVSLGLGVISYSGNHDFWTNLDWVER